MKALADFFIGEVFELDAEGARIREREVGLAVLGEVRIDLEAVAHITDNDEGRVRLLGRQIAHIALGLALRAHHGVVPLAGAAHGSALLFVRRHAGLDGGQLQRALLHLLRGELLRLEHEVTAPVEIDEIRALSAGHLHGELEAVTVVVAVRWLRHAEDVREPDEEALRVRALIGLGLLPVGDKSFGSVGSVRHQMREKGEKNRATRKCQCVSYHGNASRHKLFLVVSLERRDGEFAGAWQGEKSVVPGCGRLEGGVCFARRNRNGGDGEVMRAGFHCFFFLPEGGFFVHDGDTVAN